ncbi:MAG: exopolysaccharide biosynthesis protein [Rickettsiales bacterium]|jgi:hypothetical protein|nr:exopolysaccharide biosynthesis protein [Rickettsiales bacterium]
MKTKKISVLLSDMKNNLLDDRIFLEQIFFFDENNSYFTILLMAALSFIPTPFIVPVASNFFGALMAVSSFQIIFKKKIVKIPNKFLRISIKRSVMIKIVEKTGALFRKLEFLTKHRLLFLLNSKTKLQFLNVVIFLLSILVLMPLPFVTNPPALAVILIILGLTNRDGLFVLAGLLLAAASFGLMFLLCLKGKAFLFGVISFVLRRKTA